MVTKKKAHRAVLVTTAHRGVFFGYVAKDDGKIVTLKNARNCIYWTKAIGGFLGLASLGPNASCRIGVRADGLKLYDVTSVSDCTQAAVKAWEEAPSCS